MATKDLTQEKKLKYNQYHRHYYHRKRAEQKALVEKMIENKFKSEIRGGM